MNKESKLPLMPKATAVWLVDNTTLTFKQIADFCGLHTLEIQGIADRESNSGVLGIDPVAASQLTKEEIERCSKDPNSTLKLKENPIDNLIKKSKKKAPKYIPISKRQDKPDAIYWLLKNFPTIADSDIIKLIGTTRSTITEIRNRTHSNMINIKPLDPVTLGICSQTDINNLTGKLKIEENKNPAE